MQGQSEVLWKVSFTAIGLRTLSNYVNLYILGNDVEVAVRKARKFLKKDGGFGIMITSVDRQGTIDVF